MKKEKTSVSQKSINETGAAADNCMEPQILEEIEVEELSIDGICGVY